MSEKKKPALQEFEVVLLTETERVFYVQAADKDSAQSLILNSLQNGGILSPEESELVELAGTDEGLMSIEVTAC